MTSSPPTDPDLTKLVGMHRAEFERAKLLQARAGLTAVAVAVLSIVGVFVRTPPLTYVATGLSLVAFCTGRALSWWSQRLRGTAERGRRALVLTHSMGWRLCGKEKADLLADFTASPQAAAVFEDPNYFAGISTPGPPALATTLEESAFWSKHLFRASARGAWGRVCLAGAALLVVLLALPLMPDSQSAIVVARVLCACMTFVVAVDLVGTAMRYSAAALATGDVDTRLQGVIAGGCSLVDIINLFCDYNSSVESAPLIPTAAYERHRDKLNQLWRARQQPVSDSAVPPAKRGMTSPDAGKGGSR